MLRAQLGVAWKAAVARAEQKATSTAEAIVWALCDPLPYVDNLKFLGSMARVLELHLSLLTLTLKTIELVSSASSMVELRRSGVVPTMALARTLRKLRAGEVRFTAQAPFAALATTLSLSWPCKWLCPNC